MGRRKKSEIEAEKAKKVQESIENSKNVDQENENQTQDKKKILSENTNLPNKDLFRIDEAADYFDVSERTIRRWMDHRILEKVVVGGIVRIPRESILNCRFNNKDLVVNSGGL